MRDKVRTENMKEMKRERERERGKKQQIISLATTS